ncbi:MAG: hypothetical protein HND27_09885 [Bacteroidetes bacterium]|nr:hypothetical protein [Bacteroidota bacterium]MBV6461707.1 hypothetical protein [Flavobacteriales bacterium]WKZ75110.1 MAG: hypothetical protein QY303_13280 [Vicingaceae bacterium]MCL4815491.1 hypothetical protein [Flavobacteriales bacterium]NOG96071.1 hypothetical protein [Bacteroidota bacterium]
MISKILLTLFVCIFFQHAKSQKAEIIASTDSIAAEINALPLKEEESLFIEFSTAAGIATSYSYKKEVVKVARSLQLPYGIWQTNYYYQNGKLVLIEDIEETHLINENGEIDYSSKEQNYCGRFYFSHNALIVSKEKGEKRNASETLFNEQMELIQAKLYLVGY